jgi:predicted Zn-dependent protease
MLDLIKAALGRHDGATDWTLRRVRSRSTQLYLIGRSIENLREVETEEYELDVYNDHPFPADFRDRDGAAPAGPARGSASVTLVPGMRGAVAERIADAVAMARLVHSPRFDLPERAEAACASPGSASGTSGNSARAAAVSFAEELWGLVERERGVRLSAAELFLTTTDLELHNSRDLQVGTSTTRLLSEIVLLARGDGGSSTDEEAEHFRQIETRQLPGLRLEEQVAEAARFARDTLRTRAPRTRVGPVVLEGEALVTLFDAFAFQASARAAYQKLATTELGQSVLGDRQVKGDELTIGSNALRPYGLGSYRFDPDGVPGQEVLLIENGILRRRVAGQRYAQYLGVPATGQMGAIEVAAGTAPLPELVRGEPVLRVVKFSSPEVDPVTGDFGTEIRLAYEEDGSGGEPQPVKGGSVSGNVFDAFADARLASGLRELPLAGFSAGGGAYAGPEAVRFASLRVSGDE